MDPIILSGYIFKDEDGFYNSHCVQLDLATCGRSLEEVTRRTESMIRAHFITSKQIGTYDALVSQLQAPAAATIDPALVPFKTNFEVRASRP